VPIGTLLSLAICTALYIAVGFCLTGLVPYAQLDVADPIAVAVNAGGAGLLWLRPVVKVGALLGLTSVIGVLIMGQARIFWAMARDGLLPPAFAALHPRFATPHVTTAVTGGAAALVAGLLPVDVLGEMVSIGTLAAFAVVCGGVLVLRRTRPHLARPFAVPYSPLLPALGVGASLVQMAALPPETWARLVAWMGVGLCIYYGYSRHHATPMALRLAQLFEGVEGGSALAEELAGGGGGGPEAHSTGSEGSSGEGGGTPLIAAGAAGSVVDDGALYRYDYK
jgi:APA family basic amino acid/polyamine antiporter